MPEFAYSALTAVIFTSAAGALVMCLLVFKYGFAPDPDELPSAGVRRVFITRIGHAIAGTCFAVSAIMAAVTLADISGVARPTAVPDDRVARDERLAALASRVSATESGLQRADERVRRMEADLRRAAPRDHAIRPAVTPAPAPVVTAPRPPAPTSRPPAASIAPPAASPSAASIAPPAVSPPPPAVSPAPPAVSPAPPVVRVAPAAAPVTPPPAPVARPVVPVASRAPVRKTPPPPDDFASRLRRDWDAIKRGFATAGTDFRAALDEQARLLRDMGD